MGGGGGGDDLFRDSGQTLTTVDECPRLRHDRMKIAKNDVLHTNT